jgi:murein DD-endopeptidase MepM/ murein hydrolase activator NlpD
MVKKQVHFRKSGVGKRLSLLRYGVFVEIILVLILLAAVIKQREALAVSLQVEEELTEMEQKESIKWVDFNVSYEALCLAYEWDEQTHGTEHEVQWIEVLAYVAAKTGANFDKTALTILDDTAQKLSTGEVKIEELTADMKYYDYYCEAYTAVLGGMVGEYEAEMSVEGGTPSYQTKYGLKAYFPLARGFQYSHYDDFGAGRSYGYKRKHLGHDMMGQTGTPIIAVESGVVEAIGWNQYGGWRVGIRSFDGRRYYYYAHLRQNYPYAEGLEEGSVVTAGDVIGYMGHTGYSVEENVNNIEVTHLHWGMELIFDEKRREEGYEIWIDIYPLTRFLEKHTQETRKIQGTKEWIRTTDMIDPDVQQYLKD